MAFPAVQTSGLVTSGNIVAKSASYTAANGDVALVTTGSSTITVTLPPVAQGGPVTVRKVDTGGTGTAKVVTADGSQIDGGSGSTGVTYTTASTISGATFVSDGTNWWCVSKG